MKKTLTIKLAAILLGCSAFPLAAQQATGLFAGNHNAPYSAFQNPANTMPDLNRMYINFWGANVGFTNNALTYNAPFGMNAWANGNYPDQYKSGDNLLFNQDWIQWGNAKNQKLYYLSEVYGPSVFFRAAPGLGMGFGVRNVSGISMTGVNAELGKLFRFGPDTTGGAYKGDNALVKNKTYSNGPFSINIDNYNEWFFSLAGAKRNQGVNYWKWGATGKFLVGTGNAYLGANKLDYTLNGNQITLNNTDLQFKHTSDGSIVDGVKYPFGLNFNEVNGAGFGLDLGFVYENRTSRPARTLNNWWDCTWGDNTQYDWKFGASLTDLGIIGYQGSTRLLDISTAKTYTFNNNTLNNWQSFGEDRFAKVDKGFFDDSSLQAGIGNNYSVLTPAALNAQLDMRVGHNFFFGVNWSQSLKGQNSLGLRKASYLNFVPRWEGEHAEIGLPVTLTRDYTALNVGLYGRVGPFTLGTDNLAGLAKFATNTPYKSANIYFAVRLQLPTCGWYHYDEYDSVATHDTIVKTDTTNFWKRDTVRITKHDTIYKNKVVRDTIKMVKHDTIVKYKTTNGEDLKKREAELSKKEAAAAQKEADLKKREEEIKRKENTNMGTGGDCRTRIAELEDQLRRERDLYNKLNKQYNDCSDERLRQEAKIRDLEAQLVQLRKQNGDLNTENNNLRIEIERLKQEIARLKLNNNPCGAQIKTLDSLLAIEQKKNADQAKELAAQKARVTQQDAEIAANKKRISDLEAELATTKANCTNSKVCDDKIKAIQVELDAEKAKTATLTKQVATVTADKDAAQKENSTLKTKAAADADEIAKLKKQLDELRKEYDFEIAENAKLREQLKNCGSSTEAAKLKADLDASNKKVAELTTQLAKVTGEKEALEKENATLKAKATVDADENAKLKKQLDDLRKEYDFEIAENAKLREQLKNCGSSEEAAKLKADLDASNKKVAELTAQLAKVTGEKETLEKENSGLKAKVTQMQTDLDGLKKQLDDANAQIADLNNKLKNCGSDAELAKAKADLATANAKVADLQSKVDDLTKAKAKAEADLADAKGKIADLEAKLKDCSSNNCDDVKAELTSTKNKYNVLKEEYDALLAERNKFKSDLDKCKSDLANCSSNSSNNDDLKAEIAKLKTTITELNGEVAGKQKSLDDLQSAYDKLDGQNADLKKQIADLQNQVKALNTQVADLQAKLKACQDANPGGGGN